MSKRKRKDNLPPGRDAFDPRRVKAEQEPTLFGASEVQRATNQKPPPASDGGTGQTETSIITVSVLTRLIRGALQQVLPGTIRVVGEVSNLSRPSGGHIYFTLKDEWSEVRCVMWRSDAVKMKFDPADGLEVIVSGEVDVYESRGQYQLYVRRMEPRGVGSLELAFRQLKERLEKEGLFDAARKRPIPRTPRTVAVVTSPTGAAIRDILQTLGRRYPVVRVLVYPIKVQGEGAAEEIVDAIRRINLARVKIGGVDVMIVGRGGGSLEDLWAFNEEPVARAIHQSEIPVVSAVGHEVDFTIADFVADLRAATPTAAAELVVPNVADLLAELDSHGLHLNRAIRGLMNNASSRLAIVERCEWFRDPLGQIARREQQVDEATSRLRLAMSHHLASCRSSLHALEVRVMGVRPEAMLSLRRERLAKVEHRLHWAASQMAIRFERRVGLVEARLRSATPRRFLEQFSALLKQLDERLTRGMKRSLSDLEKTVSAFEGRLAASSHAAVLNRGFTITRRAADDKIIRRVTDVERGEALTTETIGGRIRSRVEE